MASVCSLPLSERHSDCRARGVAPSTNIGHSGGAIDCASLCVQAECNSGTAASAFVASATAATADVELPLAGDAAELPSAADDVALPPAGDDAELPPAAAAYLSYATVAAVLALVAAMV